MSLVRHRQLRYPALSLGAAVAASTVAVACGPRVGYLEVALPVAEGLDASLFAQVRAVSGPGDRAGLPAAPVPLAVGEPLRYSIPIEAEPADFWLEVCVCRPRAPGEPCFDAEGSCTGAGASAGGLYRFRHTRTAFVGVRTRWEPRETSSCGPGSSECVGRIDDLAGETREEVVSPCDVAGCVAGLNPGTHCWPSTRNDPDSPPVHRCEPEPTSRP